MLVIAHRSGPDIYPGQTVLSALRALENGADMVEIDTRFTKDDAIVISHDETALPHFGVDRAVADMTLAEFMALRVKTNPIFPSHRLTDYLEAGVKPLLIHVKEGGRRLPALIDCLRAHDALAATTLGLHSTEDVAIVRALAPEVRILAFMPKAEDREAFLAAGVDVVRLWEPWVTPEAIDAIHAAGRQVWIMSRNPTVGYTTPEQLRLFRDLGADGVLINEVPKALPFAD